MAEQDDFYDDPRYQVLDHRELPEELDPGTATFTASDHAITAEDVSDAKLPMFHKAKLLAVRVLCDAAAPAVGTVMDILNGTATMATVTLTGATAGEMLTGTVVAAAEDIDSGNNVTYQIRSTGTASENLDRGDYYVYHEFRELYES